MTEPETTRDPAAGTGSGEPSGPAEAEPTKGRDPVVRVTRLVLAVCAVVFVWYLFADRYTPTTSQARVRALFVPIAPQVSGAVESIEVRLHSEVTAGDPLFRLDRRPFEAAVRSAQAALENAAQQVGAQGAGVESAAASLGVARAQLDRAQWNYDRTQRILADNPGALSQADRDRTETTLEQAEERVASAEANLDKAKKQLGTEGPENPQIRAAAAALEQAQLNLEFSVVLAPAHGWIESFNIDVGHYAQTGQPLATLVSKGDAWIEAAMRENNLGRIRPGNRAEIVLDSAPGRVFRGTVRSVGYGVSTGHGTSRGELPTMSSSQAWLRDPQRFPVIVALDDGEAVGLVRSGGQANVVVYTSRNPILNPIAWVRIRLTSLISYVQ